MKTEYLICKLNRILDMINSKSITNPKLKKANHKNSDQKFIK